MINNFPAHNSFLNHYGAGNSQTHYHTLAHDRRMHEQSVPNSNVSAVNTFMASKISTHSSLKQERFISMGSY